MRVIKRYSNRKLYDTQDKKYVTLEQLGNLIEEGEEIQVIDNESGEDLTKVTLSQILYEKEKKGTGDVPKSFLSELIKGGNTLLTRFTSLLPTGYLSEDSTEKMINRLVKRGELTLDEGRKLKDEIMERTTQFKERWDKKVEDQVAEILNSLNIPHMGEVEELREEVEALSEKVDQLLQAQTEKKATTAKEAKGE